MLSNLLKNRVQIIQKTITQGVLGKTVTYKLVESRYALVRPLSAQARAQYQQLNSVVDNEIVFRGDVTIALGEYRIKHGSKTYEPVEPAHLVDGNTIVAVKEI